MYLPILTFLETVFALMYAVLTQDLTTYAPSAYAALENMTSMLVGVGLGVCVISFLMGQTNAAVTLLEHKSLVSLIKTYLRLIIVAALVSRSVDSILLPLFSVVRDTIAELFAAVGLGSESDFLGQIANYFEEAATNPFEVTITSMMNFNIYTLIFSIAAVVSGIVLLLTVIGRFLKIYVYFCFAPIAVGFFGGGNTLSRYGQNYAANVIAVVAEGITISVCIIIFRAIVSDAALVSAIENMFGFLGDMAKPGMIVLYLGSLSAMIKGADTLTHKLLGFS